LNRAKGRRTFAFDESLAAEVVEQAKLEKMPAEELAVDIMTTGLRRRRTGSVLKDRWESLSPREQEVTALTCLGYTNRQIGSRLGIVEETVKTHIKNVLIKFSLHGKNELQRILGEWDFSKWDK
jgi:DNA-binding CsgD family transcriptional regulator